MALKAFQKKKFGTLFDIFVPIKDEKLTLEKFMISTKKLYGSENNPHYIIVKTLKEGWWRQFVAQKNLPYYVELDKAQWLSLWDKVVTATKKDNKPPAWSQVITLSVFQSLILPNSKKVSFGQYKRYLKSLAPIDTFGTNAVIEDNFDILSEGPDGLDVNKNEDLLTAWLTNQNENKPKPGDFYPLCGYLKKQD